MSIAQLIIIDSVLWALWSALVGYCASRLRQDALKKERLRVRADSWQLYVRLLKIKKWKDKVPEAGALFPGGKSKRRLVGSNAQALDECAQESQRAEFVHWAILLLTPIFFFFNPIWLFGFMVLYGFMANLPFIAIQRYNRSRVLRLKKYLSTKTV
ncbi:MAG TPA: hypothetical protein PKB15_06115 [Acidimicrobiia bacterium]|nr:hypothetical protein [Acidimicrobiia bacterium]